MGVARATFPHEIYESSAASLACDGTLSATEALACDWKDVTTVLAAQSVFGDQADSQQQAVALRILLKVRAYRSLPLAGLLSRGVDTQLTSHQFCKSAQKLLSSTASNYDVRKLYTGMSFAAVALLLAGGLCWPLLSLGSSSAGWAVVLVTTLLGVMMFASSYVEEEHQFWLWATAAWLTALLFKRYVRSASINSSTLATTCISTRQLTVKTAHQSFTPSLQLRDHFCFYQLFEPGTRQARSIQENPQSHRHFSQLTLPCYGL